PAGRAGRGRAASKCAGSSVVIVIVIANVNDHVRSLRPQLGSSRLEGRALELWVRCTKATLSFESWFVVFVYVHDHDHDHGKDPNARQKAPGSFQRTLSMLHCNSE
ncbi:MAG: hypothetical protein ACOCV2_10665, partial [Persicimonas sp.]